MADRELSGAAAFVAADACDCAGPAVDDDFKTCWFAGGAAFESVPARTDCAPAFVGTDCGTPAAASAVVSFCSASGIASDEGAIFAPGCARAASVVFAELWR